MEDKGAPSVTGREDVREPSGSKARGHIPTGGISPEDLPPPRRGGGDREGVGLQAAEGSHWTG